MITFPDKQTKGASMARRIIIPDGSMEMQDAKEQQGKGNLTDLQINYCSDL